MRESKTHTIACLSLTHGVSLLLSLSLSLHLFLSPSLSLHLFLSLSLFLSVCLSVCLSVSLSPCTQEGAPSAERCAGVGYHQVCMHAKRAM